MMRKISFSVIGLVTLFLFAIANAPHIYAVFWRAPGAVVWPRGCGNDDCALRGTLRAIPLGHGDYEITKADGSVVVIPSDGFSRMTYPSTNTQ